METSMTNIFHYDFMLRAFEAGLIVATITPVIGIFLVVRRFSLMADTLSHVSLVGVATALLTHTDPIIGALISTVFAAFGMEELRTSRKIYGDSVLALFLSGSLAIAVILIGLAKHLNVNMFAYLFGNITTVTQTDLIVISLFGTAVLITIGALYDKLFFISYDEELAQANGLNVKRYNIILVILAAITVSLAMRIVGVLLVGALMVIPTITAIQYKKGFRQSLFISLLFSLCSVVIGILASFYFNVASGGSIVLVNILFFIVSLIVNH